MKYNNRSTKHLYRVLRRLVFVFSLLLLVHTNQAQVATVTYNSSTSTMEVGKFYYVTIALQNTGSANPNATGWLHVSFRSTTSETSPAANIARANTSDQPYFTWSEVFNQGDNLSLDGWYGNGTSKNCLIGNSKVGWAANETRYARIQIQPTGPGDFYIQYWATFTKAGDRSTHYSEAPNQVNGCSEYDQGGYCVYKKTITVTQTHPDVKMTSLSTIPSTPIVGQLTNIDVTIKNVGTVTANNINIRYWVDGTPVGNVTHSSLSPGSVVTKGLTGYVFPTSGHHSVYSEADSVSGELLLDNNGTSLDVNVDTGTTTAGGRIAISKSQLDYGSTLLGCAESTLLIVRNIGSSDLEIDQVLVDGAFLLHSFLLSQNPIAAGDSADLAVVVIPARLGSISGNLILQTSDPTMTSKTVPLFANTVNSMSISVSTCYNADILFEYDACPPPIGCGGPQLRNYTQNQIIVSITNISNKPIAFRSIDRNCFSLSSNPSYSQLSGDLETLFWNGEYAFIDPGSSLELARWQFHCGYPTFFLEDDNIPLGSSSVEFQVLYGSEKMVETTVGVTSTSTIEYGIPLSLVSKGSSLGKYAFIAIGDTVTGRYLSSAIGESVEISVSRDGGQSFLPINVVVQKDYFWPHYRSFDWVTDGANSPQCYLRVESHGYHRHGIATWGPFGIGTQPAQGGIVPMFSSSTWSSAIDSIVTFDASDTYDSSGYQLNYVWDFGDGTTGTGMVTKHAFHRAGLFNVSLNISRVVSSSREQVNAAASTASTQATQQVVAGDDSFATYAVDELLPDARFYVLQCANALLGAPYIKGMYVRMINRPWWPYFTTHPAEPGSYSLSYSSSNHTLKFANGTAVAIDLSIRKEYELKGADSKAIRITIDPQWFADVSFAVTITIAANSDDDIKTLSNFVCILEQLDNIKTNNLFEAYSGAIYRLSYAGAQLRLLSDSDNDGTVVDEIGGELGIMGNLDVSRVPVLLEEDKFIAFVDGLSGMFYWMKVGKAGFQTAAEIDFGSSEVDWYKLALKQLKPSSKYFSIPTSVEDMVITGMKEIALIAGGWAHAVADKTGTFGCTGLENASSWQLEYYVCRNQSPKHFGKDNSDIEGQFFLNDMSDPNGSPVRGYAENIDHRGQARIGVNMLSFYGYVKCPSDVQLNVSVMDGEKYIAKDVLVTGGFGTANANDRVWLQLPLPLVSSITNSEVVNPHLRIEAFRLDGTSARDLITVGWCHIFSCGEPIKIAQCDYPLTNFVTVTTGSPIRIAVDGPNGPISFNDNGSRNALTYLADLDNDSLLEQVVMYPANPGDSLRITVVPFGTTGPSDHYSIFCSSPSSIDTIVFEHPIDNIPTDPYSFVTVGPQIPDLQMYIDGGQYDTSSRTWTTTAKEFDLYLVCKQGKQSVRLSMATHPPSASASFDINNVNYAILNHGYAPLTFFPWQYDSGSDLEPHGVFPTYFTEFGAGDFEDQGGIGNVIYNGWLPSQGYSGAYGNVRGQIKKFHVRLNGETGGLHFDAYTLNVDGSIKQHCPIECDAEVNFISCCQTQSSDGRSGNVDGDPGKGVDISDLSALIDFLYISFTPPPCLSSANIDGDPNNGIDISDLSALIDYLYISFTPPTPCK